VRIAILGASSQIAKDYIRFDLKDGFNELKLFVRNKELFSGYLKDQKVHGHFEVLSYDQFFLNNSFDAILNFVGSGNPVKTKDMGTEILDITYHYDQMALDYLKRNSACKYIFMSSGVVYGGDFTEPVKINTKASVNINNLKAQDWYSIAKLYAESRHRAIKNSSIIDVRIFNYFSHTQDMDARFLITDIVRSIRDKTKLKVFNDNLVRDYIGPEDFYMLVSGILNSPASNDVVDCYSKGPVDKLTLLDAIQKTFNFNCDLVTGVTGLNATGSKINYYSLNHHATLFGFQPRFNSLELIIQEIDLYLKKRNSN
jgi:nucleoside-diphosphate-sugar epimerase